MFDFLKPPLRVVFHPLLVILGMANPQFPLRVPTQEAMDLPLETPSSVEQWCNLSMERYIIYPEYREYMVVQVLRYKKTNGTQHEYLVAKVHHPLHGDKYLRIERALAHLESNGAPILNSNQQGDLPPTPSDISPGIWVNWSDARTRSNPVLPPPPPREQPGSILWDSRKEGVASDVVRLVKPPSGTFLSFTWLADSNELENLEFEANPLPLVHLAILAYTVHLEASLYNLFQTQCYWYANMIARVIAREKRITNPTAEAGDPSTDTDYCYHPSSGKFWNIPVHWVRPKVITRIQEEFKTRSGTFDVEVRCIRLPCWRMLIESF